MGDVLDYLFDLFKILIPSVSVVVVVQIMLKNHFDDQKRRDELAVSKANRQDLRPLQMQAYERLILFLERIQPDSLMMRMQRPGMSARALHSSMLKNIRQEYEHNMTQQLYVSISAWKLILMARNEATKLVNLSATNLPENASAIDFGNELVKMLSKLESIPTEVAIRGLKMEFQSKFK